MTPWCHPQSRCPSPYASKCHEGAGAGSLFPSTTRCTHQGSGTRSPSNCALVYGNGAPCNGCAFEALRAKGSLRPRYLIGLSTSVLLAGTRLEPPQSADRFCGDERHLKGSPATTCGLACWDSTLCREITSLAALPDFLLATEGLLQQTTRSTMM